MGLEPGRVQRDRDLQRDRDVSTLMQGPVAVSWARSVTQRCDGCIEIIMLSENKACNDPVPILMW